MSKKDDLKAELTKLGIPFDPAASNAELAALLPAGDAVLNEPDDASALSGGLPSAAPVAPVAANGIEVGDPQLLRPVELPLVIKPANGGAWKNNEQAEYAKVLNAAAYANPTRWKQDKNAEIARLVEIGTNPERFYFYTGTTPGEANVTFKNKLHE